jgi:hypothetical protein
MEGGMKRALIMSQILIYALLIHAADDGRRGFRNMKNYFFPAGHVAKTADDNASTRH